MNMFLKIYNIIEYKEQKGKSELPFIFCYTCNLFTFYKLVKN